MVTVDIKDVENLANLARIELSEDEKNSLLSDMEDILGYVSQIESIPTKEVSEEFPVRNVMRDDVVTHIKGQYTEDLLSNAPAREGNWLKVKKILG